MLANPAVLKGKPRSNLNTRRVLVLLALQQGVLLLRAHKQGRCTWVPSLASNRRNNDVPEYNGAPCHHERTMGSEEPKPSQLAQAAE
jgi:hypothetical protein